MQKISSLMCSWTSSIATSMGPSVGCSILWWMLIFNIGGLISYVKINSKVPYLLEFFYLRSFTFANLHIFIAVSIRKLEKKYFVNIFKKISKMHKIILRTKVKTPVYTDIWIRSYHKKNTSIEFNCYDYFVKLIKKGNNISKF